MLAILALLAPATFWVAPNGSDAADGSAAHPVATVARAIVLARSRGGRIVLRPGDYPVRDTIVLGPEDRGLTLEGQRGARLFGGIALSDWRTATDSRIPPEAGAHVLECDLPPGADPGQVPGLDLTFDHQPMTLAQWPNVGTWLRTGKVVDERSFTFDEPRLARWSRPGEAWAFGYWLHEWSDNFLPARVDTAAHRIELGGKPQYGIGPGRRFFFANVLEELDQPGEWYLDRAARKVYFWPPSDMGDKSAFLGGLPAPILSLRGTANVHIRGLDLEGGRGAAIVIEGGSGDAVERCRIRNFGGSGVTVQNSPSSGVSGCELSHLGTFGIALSAGDRKTLTPGKAFADNNRIWDYARWHRTYEPAVRVDGVGNRISHNEMHDAPHNAVLLSGNDHLLEFNDVRRVCTQTGDAGAFYMGRDATMRGNQIRFNRFRDIGPTVTTEGEYTGVISVYLDDCWDGTTIYGNVFEGPGIGIMIGGGRDNLVENNVFLGKTAAIHVDARGKGWAAKLGVRGGEWRYIEKIDDVLAGSPIYAQRYPGLARMLEDDPMFPKGNSIVRNVSRGGQWLHLLDRLTEAQVGAAQNSIGPAASLSDALRHAPPGFRAILLRQIGPRVRSLD